MKKIIILIFILGFFAIVINPTSAFFQSSAAIDSNSFSVTVVSNTDVRLNEIMSNPNGNDDALMPGGEWVELYNTGSLPIDVNGWRLYDAINTHELSITLGNVSGLTTVIPAHGYLVVYRNGDSDFSLNNDSGGDTVRLYDGVIGLGALIDSYNYTNPVLDWVFARNPDGNGLWVASSTPTPGGPNV